MGNTDSHINAQPIALSAQPLYKHKQESNLQQNECKYTLDKQTKQINLLCESSNKQIKNKLDMCNNEMNSLHKKLDECKLNNKPPGVIRPLPPDIINPKILTHEPSSELLCGHIDNKNNMFVRSKCSIPDPNMMQATVMPTELLVSKQNPLSCFNNNTRNLNVAMLQHEPLYIPQNKGQNSNNRVWKQVHCNRSSVRENPIFTQPFDFPGKQQMQPFIPSFGNK